MAEFRRARMKSSWLLLLVLAAGVQASHHHDAAELSLNTAGAPGSLVITNRGSAELQLVRAVRIEQKSGERWKPVEAEFNLISDCAQAPVKKCVRLSAQASLTVVPWTGFSCSGQCNQSCRANVKYPAGTYRFVLASCADGAVHNSDPFELR